MMNDFKNGTIVHSLLESLEVGIAVFNADRTLLYINESMALVTGGDPESTRREPSGLLREDRLRAADGSPVLSDDLPIARAFAGIESKDVPYIYINPRGRHLWLAISCRRIVDESGALQYVFTTVGDISRRKTREDKLHFLIEEAKVLSLNTDFRKRLAEKANLAVPALADWCAIDLRTDDGTERVAVVHRDPAMIKSIYEFEMQFPSDPKRPSGLLNIIDTMQPQFVPLVTDEILRAAITSPEEFDSIKKLQLNSVMIIPITARGRGLGAMTLAYAESCRVYTRDDFQFFQEFCFHLGVLLENGLLYEELTRKERAKDLFLASLSHELRNPLAPIKNSLELLKLRDTSQDVREELETIEHQFDHMAKLLDDLLDVTRFTQDKIEIAPHTIELRRLVDRALKSTDALLRTADITLHYTYPSSAIQVWADETRIEQAISNLMSNATKYTPSGGSIWVDILKEGETAVIKVRDNGAGIDPDDLPHIFEMYYQGRNRNHASGLGIGLLLVQRIIALHGGTIEARSEGRGHGSEFIITLPTTNILDLAKPGEPHPADSIGGKHILVVDDNMPAANSLVKLFNKLGAKAEAIHSGEAAIERDVSDVDIILLDIGMPHMDGYATIQALRTKGVSIPIVALTGYGLLEDKQKALDAGFTAHLTKPVGLKDIAAMLDTVFGS